MNKQIQVESTAARNIFETAGKILPFLQAAMLIFCAAVAWYVTTQTDAFATRARLELLEKRLDAAEISRKENEAKLLTRDVYEAIHAADVERMNRLEGKVDQLLVKR